MFIKHAFLSIFSTKSSVTRTLAVFLASVVLFAASTDAWAQANLWSERRGAAQRAGASTKRPLGQDSMLVAQLPRLQAAPGLAMPWRENIASLKPVTTTAAAHRWPALPAWIRSLPSAYADIQKVSPAAGANTPWVILIQDAHDVYSAQQNIALTLEHLQKQVPFDEKNPFLIGLEGAEGPLDLAPYRSFIGNGRHEIVCDILLDRKIFSGPEVFALTTAREPFVRGIETTALYNENVEAYRAALTIKNEFDAAIRSLQEALDPARQNILDEDLRNLDKSLAAHRQGRTDLLSHVQTLNGLLPVDGRHPETQKLFSALTMEKDLDFSRAETERHALVQELSRRLPPAALNDLASAGMAFRAGQVSFSDFHRHLKNLAENNGVAMKRFPAFDRYLAYALLTDSINKFALFGELSAYEEAVVARAAKTPEQREVMALDRDLDLLARLASRELNPSDWALYKARREDIASISNRVTAVTGASAANRFKTMIPVFEKFYQAADARNEALITNLLRDLPSGHGPAIAALVAGGFHTPALERLLAQKGVSTITVTPKMAAVPEGLTYLDVFSQNQVPLEKMFLGDRLFTAPWRTTDPTPSAVTSRTPATAKTGYFSMDAVVAADGPYDANQTAAKLQWPEAARRHVRAVSQGVVEVTVALGQNTMTFLVSSVANAQERVISAGRRSLMWYKNANGVVISRVENKGAWWGKPLVSLGAFFSGIFPAETGFFSSRAGAVKGLLALGAGLAVFSIYCVAFQISLPDIIRSVGFAAVPASLILGKHSKGRSQKILEIQEIESSYYKLLPTIGLLKKNPEMAKRQVNIKQLSGRTGIAIEWGYTGDLERKWSLPVLFRTTPGSSAGEKHAVLEASEGGRLFRPAFVFYDVNHLPAGHPSEELATQIMERILMLEQKKHVTELNEVIVGLSIIMSLVMVVFIAVPNIFKGVPLIPALPQNLRDAIIVSLGFMTGLLVFFNLDTTKDDKRRIIYKKWVAPIFLLFAFLYVLIYLGVSLGVSLYGFDLLEVWKQIWNMLLPAQGGQPAAASGALSAVAMAFTGSLKIMTDGTIAGGERSLQRTDISVQQQAAVDRIINMIPLIGQRMGPKSPEAALAFPWLRVKTSASGTVLEYPKQSGVVGELVLKTTRWNLMARLHNGFLGSLFHSRPTLVLSPKDWQSPLALYQAVLKGLARANSPNISAAQLAEIRRVVADRSSEVYTTALRAHIAVKMSVPQVQQTLSNGELARPGRLFSQSLGASGQSVLANLIENNSSVLSDLFGNVEVPASLQGPEGLAASWKAQFDAVTNSQEEADLFFAMATTLSNLPGYSASGSGSQVVANGLMADISALTAWRLDAGLALPLYEAQQRTAEAARAGQPVRQGEQVQTNKMFINTLSLSGERLDDLIKSVAAKVEPTGAYLIASDQSKQFTQALTRLAATSAQAQVLLDLVQKGHVEFRTIDEMLQQGLAFMQDGQPVVDIREVNRTLDGAVPGLEHLPVVWAAHVLSFKLGWDEQFLGENEVVAFLLDLSQQMVLFKKGAFDLLMRERQQMERLFATSA